MFILSRRRQEYAIIFRQNPQENISHSNQRHQAKQLAASGAKSTTSQTLAKTIFGIDIALAHSSFCFTKAIYALPVWLFCGEWRPFNLGYSIAIFEQEVKCAI